MKNFFQDLKKNHSSILSKNNYKRLKLIKKLIPDLKISYFNSGEKVFDWRIPKQWDINSAYLKDCYGNIICDYNKNPLHVVGYSKSINKIITFNQLKKKLHFIKSLPSAIPYKTSYYKKEWGFCLPYKKYKQLNKSINYRVEINTEFKNGKLYFGECLIKGKSKKEILFTTYICHPYMANNELSGIIVNTFLARKIRRRKNYYSYRFLFLSETIGSIAYISKNLSYLKKNLLAGYVITCVGDTRCLSILLSKYKNKVSDKFALKIFNNIKYKKKKILLWKDRGSDERQFCSPGVDLPIT